MGWMDRSPGGVKYRAPYCANKQTTQFTNVWRFCCSNATNQRWLTWALNKYVTGFGDPGENVLGDGEKTRRRQSVVRNLVTIFRIQIWSARCLEGLSGWPTTVLCWSQAKEDNFYLPVVLRWRRKICGENYNNFVFSRQSACLRLSISCQ